VVFCRQKIPEDSVILDLMSSWVSHLPPERRRKRVIGHGMNEAELKQNGALDEYFLRNLNEEPSGWPVESSSIDAVVCCVRYAFIHTCIHASLLLLLLLASKPGEPM
jgi:hypothetical protein